MLTCLASPRHFIACSPLFRHPFQGLVAWWIACGLGEDEISSKGPYCIDTFRIEGHPCLPQLYSMASPT